MPASARLLVAHHEKQGFADGLGPGDAGIRSYRQSLLHGSVWPPPSFRVQPTPALIRAARARATTAVEAYANKPSADARPALSPRTALGSHHPSVPRAQQMHARALAAQAAHQQRMASEPVPDHIHQPSVTVPSQAGFAFGEGFLGFGGVPFGKQTGTDKGRDKRRMPAAGSVEYLSLNLEERCRDMIEELQVDLSLPLVDDSVSPLTDTGYTSLSASVDISAFLPPPGPPALIANDVTIAASAVPLADWAAEICWRMAFGSLSLSRRHTAGGPSLGNNNIGSVTQGSDFTNFRAFVNTTLSATLPSPQCLFLGLYYVSNLPTGCGDLLHDPALSPVNARGTTSHSLTQDQLEFCRSITGIAVGVDNRSQLIAELLFTLALMLGNKWLEDNTFTTRTWHEVTSIPQSQLKAVETAALKVMKFSLSVSTGTWQEWILRLRSMSSALVGKEPMGIPGSPNRLAVEQLNELIRLTGSLSSPGPIDDDADIVLIPAPRSGHRASASMSSAFAYPHPTGRPGYPEWTNPMFNPDLSMTGGLFSSPPYERPLYVLHEDALHCGLEGRRTSFPGAAVIEDVSRHQPWGPIRHSMERVRVGQWAGASHRWDRVEAEMAAREREQEAFVSGWPRPSVLGPTWTGHTVPSVLSS